MARFNGRRLEPCYFNFAKSVISGASINRPRDWSVESSSTPMRIKREKMAIRCEWKLNIALAALGDALVRFALVVCRAAVRALAVLPASIPVWTSVRYLKHPASSSFYPDISLCGQIQKLLSESLCFCPNGEILICNRFACLRCMTLSLPRRVLLSRAEPQVELDRFLALSSWLDCIQDYVWPREMRFQTVSHLATVWSLSETSS